MKHNFPAVVLMFFCAPVARAQQPMRLSLQQAMALATSPHGSTAVQVADAAVAAAHARVSLAHAYRYPVLWASLAESNVTTNLGAQGFNFSTGVPNFTIPEEVGPFNVFDARLHMTQTVFDLGAIRRSRSTVAAFDAATSDADANRQAAAAQAAHDYLVALAADARVTAAQAGIAQAQATVRSAQHDADTGKASDAEITQAQLRLETNRRKLSSAQNSAVEARLQLLDDLGLDFDTLLELADTLTFHADRQINAATEVAQALQNRAELKTAFEHQAQARDQAGAVHAELLPTVTVFGDVGPMDSVITHTVGISAQITVFDGGRRRAQEMESDAAVHQYAIEQRDMRRQVELQVRRAVADLDNAGAQAQACDAARTLADEALARAQRRYANGVANNAELIDAESQETQAREDQVQAEFAWNQARLELAQATGTVESFTMK
jgi:outer membrane protein